MIQTLSSAMLAWLLTYVIHSTVLLGLAWLLVRFRKLTPAASDLVWKTAMIGALMTATAQLRLDVRPAGTLSLHREVAGAAPAPTTPAAKDRTGDADVADQTLPAVADVAPVRAPPATSTSAALSRETTLVLIWTVVALILGISYAARRLILVGRIGDRELVQDGRVLEMLHALARDAAIRRAPKLTSTVRISSPIALGIREICVPETALTELDLEQQRSMLAHELAHLARRDPLWLALASTIERVFWFQPLNRVARREIATAAEYLCDEWAVRRTGSGVALARCLAQVAEWIQSSPLGVPVAGMAEERSLLVSRVARLLEGKLPASRSTRTLAAASVVVLIATVAVAPSVTGRAARASTVFQTAEAQSPARVGARFSANDRELMQEAMRNRSITAAGIMPRRVLTKADSAVTMALIARLKDEDTEVRAAAANALGKLQDARAVSGLIAALKDAAPKVRAAAANALGDFKDPRAIAGLSALLGDTSKDVRSNALDALSSYEEGVTNAGVVKLLGDEDVEIRHRAAHLLGQIKDRSSSGALAKLLHDSSASVRQAAIEALAAIHDQSSTAAIQSALSDANADVRHQALEALSELKAPIAESTLIALMRDSNADVRSRAAEIAGERSIVGTVPALRTLIEDPVSNVRESAISALANMADNSASEALRSALTSKDANVRRAAVEALGERRREP